MYSGPAYVINGNLMVNLYRNSKVKNVVVSRTSLAGVWVDSEQLGRVVTLWAVTLPGKK